MTGGRKHDDGKAPYHLLPPDAIAAVVNVLAHGADKYGERNWEKGIDLDRLFSAGQRHWWAHHGGEPLDPESGLSHLAHVACNALMALALELRDAE